jgi:RimJ/RimL family protein N-acetyltransferase
MGPQGRPGRGCRRRGLRDRRRVLPEVTIGVETSYRGRGIGGQLLIALADLAHEHGFQRLSLSVEPDNPARALYERVGYRQVGLDEDGGIVMLATIRGAADTYPFQLYGLPPVLFVSVVV